MKKWKNSQCKSKAYNFKITTTTKNTLPLINQKINAIQQEQQISNISMRCTFSMSMSMLCVCCMQNHGRSIDDSIIKTKQTKKFKQLTNLKIKWIDHIICRMQHFRNKFLMKWKCVGRNQKGFILNAFHILVFNEFLEYIQLIYLTDINWLQISMQF